MTYGDHVLSTIFSYSRRVKSGIFGQTAKSGQPPCLFHSSVIEINNKLTKQTVKIAKCFANLIRPSKMLA